MFTAWKEHASCRIVKAATESEAGMEMRVCNNSPLHMQTRIIPKLGHVHKLVRVEAKPATCTEDGNIEYWKCDSDESTCGLYFKDPGGVESITEEDTVIPALGHEWGEWDVVKPATKNADGFEVRTCKRCNEVDTHVIPALGPVKTDLSKCAGTARNYGFTDLDPNAWCMNMPDGNFLTREQLTTMIFRYCVEVKGQSPRQIDLSRFSDRGEIASWALDGVAHCVVYSIVSGYADGSCRFAPHDTAMRCQAAKIIAVTAFMLE